MYGPRFRSILQAVSEVVYAANGFSESEVSITLHKYMEVEQDVEVIDIIRRMEDTLRLLFCPPRVLELPDILSIRALASIGLGMLHSGTIYRRRSPGALDVSTNSSRGKKISEWLDMADSRNSEQQLASTESSDKDLPDESRSKGLRAACGARLGVLVQDRQLELETKHRVKSAGMEIGKKVSEEGLAHFQGQDAQINKSDFAIGSANEGKMRGEGDAFGESFGTGVYDLEEMHHAKIKRCLSALNCLRKSLEVLQGHLEQPHLQALAEAYLAEYSKNSTTGRRVCAFPKEMGRPVNSGDETVCAFAAIEEVSCAPFMDNEVLAMLRDLELKLEGDPEKTDAEEGQKERREFHSSSTNDGGGEKEFVAAKSLESLLTSLAYRRLADESLVDGRIDDAEELLDGAFSEGLHCVVNRHLADLLAARARCYLQKNELERAISTAEKALMLDACSRDALLVRGQSLRKRGNYQEALHDLVKALVLNGDDGGIDDGEGRAIDDVAREACRAHARKFFVERIPTGTLPANWVVRSYFASYNDEINGERNGHDRWPQHHNSPIGDKSGSATILRALDHGKPVRYSESMASLAEALDVEDKKLRSLVLEHYGSFLNLAGDLKGSLEMFRRAAEVDSMNAKSWVKKGSVLSDLGQKEEALVCFDAAEAINPMDSDVSLHRGQVYLVSNEFSKASESLRRSIDLCPELPIAWAALGVALFKLAVTDGEISPIQMAECLEVMEEALRRFPESAEICIFFAEVLTGLGDFARALGLLRESSSLEPDNPLPFLNAARAYLAMNDVATARRHLEHGRSLDPEYSGVYLDMGQLLMHEGRHSEALDMFSRGVEKARFPSEVHDALSYLEVARCHVNVRKHLSEDVAIGGLI